MYIFKYLFIYLYPTYLSRFCAIDKYHIRETFHKKNHLFIIVNKPL
jgi:hypothetical protein